MKCQSEKRFFGICFLKAGVQFAGLISLSLLALKMQLYVKLFHNSKPYFSKENPLEAVWVFLFSPLFLFKRGNSERTPWGIFKISSDKGAILNSSWFCKCSWFSKIMFYGRKNSFKVLNPHSLSSHQLLLITKKNTCLSECLLFNCWNSICFYWLPWFAKC